MIELRLKSKFEDNYATTEWKMTERINEFRSASYFFEKEKCFLLQTYKYKNNLPECKIKTSSLYKFRSTSLGKVFL